MAEIIEMVEVAALDEVRRLGVVVAQAGTYSLAIFADGDAVHAVDNRCPHMGFPLHQGSVSGGILTCHWHEARFELSSGCTFDLWADDAISFATEIRGGAVFAATAPTRTQNAEFHLSRLRRGMEHSVNLVQAKSLASLLGSATAVPQLLAGVVAFASENSNRFGEGLVRLTCVARLQPLLQPETLYLGLSYAVDRLSAESNAGPARRPRGALSGARITADTLAAWLPQWVRTRHRDAAERTLLTAVDTQDETTLGSLVFGAAGVRRYADGGHTLDACNKAFELTDILDSESRQHVFPLLCEPLTGSRGGEESTPWHHPIELAAAVDEAYARLPPLLGAGTSRRHSLVVDGPEELALVDQLLEADPLGIVGALDEALASGVAPAEVADTVAYAAGMRLARFAPSNEVGDWFNPQHTFIFSNAVAQAVRRSETAGVVRSIYDAAMAVYLDRYLNVPPAPLPPDEPDTHAHTNQDSPARDGSRRAELLEVFDSRGDGAAAAALVSRYLLSAATQPYDTLRTLVDTLALATLREDLDFHSLQVLEAATTQTLARERQALGSRVSSRTTRLFVGVARNLAAHCPTRRAGQQTASIAQRLQRGERIFEAATSIE